MQQPDHHDKPGLTPSVYYTEILINCPLEKAWNWMVDYQSWNPDFATAKVTPVTGDPVAEGGRVLIQLFDANQELTAEFYADTVKVVPQSHFVWYIYPKQGDAFCNFVDFGLSVAPTGVKFSISIYAQNPVNGEALVKLRQDSEAGYRNLALAFKKYCESRS